MGLSKFLNRSKIKSLIKYTRNSLNQKAQKFFKGLLKNPVFYFSLISLVLFGGMFFSSGSLANISGFNNSEVVFFNSFFNEINDLEKNDLFSSQANASVLESPDFKIIQGNTLAGVSTPTIVTGKVLGSVLGSSGASQSSVKKEIINYVVQPGDTLHSIANAHGISADTILSANEISSASLIKVGQNLIILPTDGVLHIVKSGDTISGIAQTYKSKQEEIIAFNELASQSDIYIGDILIVPGGVIPKKVPTAPSAPSKSTVASTYFIFPTEGRVSQGLHYYNAIDVANKCGTPIYAAAGGTVQRVSYGWNFGGGNLVTILHSNGTVTYYGHLQTIFVKSGQKVNTGDRIGLMGGQPGTPGAGISTGCHLHFGVTGARNPLAGYAVGATIKYSR
jgi:murein DD-endopeptidase MepM/ murein hydrolase activator NlpD